MAPPAAEIVRCFDGDARMRAYHDQEWGRPVLDERGLYERLCLEAFQSGISWRIVLSKRDALRRAFFNFEPEHVARFEQEDVNRLMADPGVIRNRAKIEAAIANARAAVALRDAGEPLPVLIWSFRPTPIPAPETGADLPASTPASAALAAALKRRGFRFVGPTTMYALMQAAGLVNDHLAACWVRRDVEQAQLASGPS